MLPEGQTVLCAVSGGTDSMCLLQALGELKIDVYAAHFNHCLRAEESDRDENFVRQWCEEKKIPFICERGDVLTFAQENDMGIEEAARKLRYEFLERSAAKAKAQVIATAHNADDNTETILFNLTRGTGLKGLCGIPPRRGNIVRPLLTCSRKEIEQYVNARKIPHVEDSTNAETNYSRNKIRHLVMPVLREINPSLEEGTSRLSRTLRDDENCLSDIAQQVFSLAEINPQGVSISAELLRAQPEAIQSRVLRLAVKAVGGSMDSGQTAAAQTLVFSNKPNVGVDVGNNVRVRREYEDLKVQQGMQKVCSFKPQVLEIGQAVEINELKMTIMCCSKLDNGKIHKTFNNLLFKKSAIRGNITVRPRVSGDYIKLSGRNVGKTLKKLFIEKQIPVGKREMIPVFADDEGVIAVLGIGISERVKSCVGDEVLEIKIRNDTV